MFTDGAGVTVTAFPRWSEWLDLCGGSGGYDEKRKFPPPLAGEAGIFTFHHTPAQKFGTSKSTVHTNTAMRTGFPSAFIHCDYISLRSGDFFVRASRKCEKAQFFGCAGKAGYV